MRYSEGTIGGYSPRRVNTLVFLYEPPPDYSLHFYTAYVSATLRSVRRITVGKPAGAEHKQKNGFNSFLKKDYNVELMEALSQAHSLQPRRQPLHYKFLGLHQ